MWVGGGVGGGGWGVGGLCVGVGGGGVGGWVCVGGGGGLSSPGVRVATSRRTSGTAVVQGGSRHTRAGGKCSTMSTHKPAACLHVHCLAPVHLHAQLMLLQGGRGGEGWRMRTAMRAAGNVGNECAAAATNEHLTA